MKNSELMKRLKAEAEEVTPDVFDSIVSTAKEQGIVESTSAAKLGAAHAASGIAGGSAKIIISSFIAALAVTAAVGGTMGASLAVNYSQQVSNQQQAQQPVDPPVDPNPPVLLVETEGLEYEEIEGGYAVVGIGIAEDKDIVIPKMHEGKPVKEIAAHAFDRHSISKFTIQDNIEKIGEGAFNGRYVQTFTVDAGNARYCVKNNCIIDKTEKTLVAAAIDGTIPTDGSVTVIGGFAFSNHSADVAIPEGIEKIGNSAFESSSIGSTDGLKLPESLKEIGDNAFQWCEFDSIAFPSNLEKIGEDAFYECSLPENVVLNQGLKQIGTSAFSMCRTLKTINLPASLEYIGAFVFAGDTELQSVNYEASGHVWTHVDKASGWNYWSKGPNSEEINLGDKFKTAELGEADVWGTVAYDYSHTASASYAYYITFDKNGTLIMQKTTDGEGDYYDGVWTASLGTNGRVVIDVTYNKCEMHGGVASSTATESGTMTFELWYEADPNFVGNTVTKHVRLTSAANGFCDSTTLLLGF